MTFQSDWSVKFSKMFATKSAQVRFTEEESEYLQGDRLGRLATSSTRNNNNKDEPHVVPVAYEFDGNCIYFGGWNLEKSLKFRNIKSNNNVAIVIDDLASVNPWRPRGIEIRGTAEIQETEDGQFVKITPKQKVSWGL